MTQSESWFLQGYNDGVAEAAGDIHMLREAIRLTREYVGDRTLPAVEGWTWFDAIKATGGFEGFGTCGCALDPWVWGRPQGHHVSDTGERKLYYCTYAPDHDGDCGLKDPGPTRTCSGLCTEHTADAACPVHGIVGFLQESFEQ